MPDKAQIHISKTPKKEGTLHRVIHRLRLLSLPVNTATGSATAKK